MRTKRVNLLIDSVIYDYDYEGIRDQDGWEVLEATVRMDNSRLANEILKRLQELQESGETIGG